MKQGINIVGKLSGVVVEPWAREGKSGVNVTLGISRTFLDRFGSEDTETFAIDVRGDQLQHRLREQAEKLRGKVVSIEVRVMAFAGRNGAFAKFSATPDAELVPLITSAPAAASGARPAA
jgi:hypothetical protein